MKSVVRVIRQEENTYSVTYSVGEVTKIIGFGIERIYDAISLAESYQFLDPQIELIIDDTIKTRSNYYREVGKIAKSIGLPTDSFNAFVDKVVDYREEMKDKAIQGPKDFLHVNKLAN